MEFAKKGNEPLLLENRNRGERHNSDVIIPKLQKTLIENGYQVETNVGSSDFKIDLACCRPKK